MESQLLLNVIIKQEDKGYSVICPELNVASQGETFEEAISNIKEAVELYIETAEELGTLDDVLEIVKEHGKTELIFTGRDAPKELMEAADYVNVIQRIKHPWQKGIVARRGIEY